MIIMKYRHDSVEWNLLYWEINRKIQGDADILIFHDIHSANYAYKIFTHLLKWKTGSILVGTKAPCILTSRSDSFDVKFNSIILSGLYYDYLTNKKDS